MLPIGQTLAVMSDPLAVAFLAVAVIAVAGLGGGAVCSDDGGHGSSIIRGLPLDPDDAGGGGLGTAAFLPVAC